MHNRRNFIVQTSLATAAIALLKPLKSIASAPMNAVFTSEKISILNIGCLPAKTIFESLDFNLIDKLQATLQQDKCYSLLLGAADLAETDAAGKESHLKQLRDLKKAGLETISHVTGDHQKKLYQNSLAAECKIHSFSQENGTNTAIGQLPHHIVYKGAIKVGIIHNEATVRRTMKQTLLQVNKTAEHLKTNENCNLIVLVQANSASNNQKSTKDDIEFAGLTRYVDVMVSDLKTTRNYTTSIAQNKDLHEVIISFAADDDKMAERVELTFNQKMKKTGFSLHRVA